MLIRQNLISLSAVVGLVFAAPVWADEDKQDLARQAVLAGEVAPLSKLLSVVEQDYTGDIVKIELEDEDSYKWGGPDKGRIYIYEIKVLTTDGNLVKLKYDAKTLELLATNDYNRRDKHD